MAGGIADISRVVSEEPIALATKTSEAGQGSIASFPEGIQRQPRPLTARAVRDCSGVTYKAVRGDKRLPKASIKSVLGVETKKPSQ